MIYDPSRTWDIVQADITLTTNNGYFLYVKVPISEEVTTAEVFADEAHIDPLRDEGFIIYKQGYITPPLNGVRQISLIQGNIKTEKRKYRQTPSGDVDGVNTTFTIAEKIIAGSEEVFINGQLAEPDKQYTIVYGASSATITTLRVLEGAVDDVPAEIIRVNYSI